MGPLISQLEDAFAQLTSEPLDSTHLAALAQNPGVYQLWHAGRRVYVGKADRDLQSRLGGHHRKIGGRLNISLADMAFTALYLEATWIPVGAERGLIDLYDGGTPGVHLLPWNNNGFGINDPGKERDTTNFKAQHFDVLYPADLTVNVAGLLAGQYPTGDLLRTVKGSLPWVFRFENQWARHPDYLGSTVAIPHDDPTAEEVFDAIISALPSGWQITALPGYTIMYKAHRAYPRARRTWQS
jgi:hypothetical protein